MKIVNFGESFQIYPDDLKTFDTLPAFTYRVVFNEMSGFSLTKVTDMAPKESKVYGPHLSKVNKVMRTYRDSERALGVILSGDKGIGKTMSLQLLSQAMIRDGHPVIIIDKSYPGLDNFIDSIKQSALVIFDEFEKVFSKNDQSSRESQDETQTSLLSLFDGTSSVKRLYALTINNLHATTDYILNRPGRFHYHFRYDYPTIDEVAEYLTDNCDAHVDPKEIDNAANFSLKVPLNFDMLRAIAKELSYGETFKSAIEDLNIMQDHNIHYELHMTLHNGVSATCDIEIDMFAPLTCVIMDDYSDRLQTSIGGSFTLDTSKLQYRKTHIDVPVSAISDLDAHYKTTTDNTVPVTLADIKVAQITVVNTNKLHKYAL